MKRLMFFSIKTKLVLAGGFLLLIFSLVSFHSILENKKNTAIFADFDQLRAEYTKIHETIDVANGIILQQAQTVLNPSPEKIRAIGHNLMATADRVNNFSSIDTLQKNSIRENFILAAAALRQEGSSAASLAKSITLSKDAVERLKEIENSLDDKIRYKREAFRSDLIKKSL